MIKIGEVKSQSSHQIDNLNRTNKDKKEGIRGDFLKELEKLDEMSTKEKLDVLLGKIDKQAEKLSKNMDIKDLLIYKKLISEFMKESVNSMVKFSKNSFLDRRGRHRVHGIIKKVDEELGNLTEDILSKEKDNIKVLKTLEDIRGLILDIYM
ncbi:hypothetical protein CLPU_2c02790 [Gottschalkia purinilytica]|uniref:DUF327 domain-containing protein n=1 Tax=Gottschalkia purinilytica TaxID=1503 RepID=A0A0L0WEC1_GOTPU|nr:YaaR family protein [Gottschalkia purinilytica]KNF09827.1 hypothetical protein CLPU_2c02790 [Gottschalkia purinilytica]